MSHAHPVEYGPPSSPSDDRPPPIRGSAWAAFGEPRKADAPARERARRGPPSVTESLAPLWRYLIWGLAVAIVATMWAALRVQVRQLRLDIEHLDNQRAELLEQRDQLLLDRGNRRRVLSMEAAAKQVPLVTAPRRIVPAAPPGGAP